MMVHGLDGFPSDFDLWVSCLAGLKPELRTMASESFTASCCFWNGSGCIVQWARSLAGEVSAQVEALAKEGARSVVLHFVCHSLGGLITRQALPLLKTFTLPVSFGHLITLNSPHMGVRNWWKGLGGLLARLVGKFQYLRQLTLHDDSQAGMCYLEQLANETACLKEFQSRTAVAATHFDVMVPFCTAAICSTNPFPSPSSGERFWRVDAVHGFSGSTAFVTSPEAHSCAREFEESLKEDLIKAGQEGMLSSSDHAVEFTAATLKGMQTCQWRRVAYTLSMRREDAHLFAVGKDHRCNEAEEGSRAFIQQLIRSVFT